MTDLEMVRALLAKVPFCTVIYDEDTHILIDGTYGYENIIFEFDEEGNLIAIGT